MRRNGSPKAFGHDFNKTVVVQKPAVYSEILVALDRVIAGEHDFVYRSNKFMAYPKGLQGAPIRWLHPEPTPVAPNSWHGISKYAPHPNAARLFVNWFTSEGGAQSILNSYGGKPSMEGVKDTRKMHSELWYSPPKTRYHVDWERWEKNYHKDMDFWIKTMMEGR